jgi:hypothetical protein
MWKCYGIMMLVSLLLSSLVWAEGPAFKSLLFDGSSFKEARGEGAVLVRDGLLPQVAEDAAPREDPLPPGTGAAVLLCYRQTSGGKLRPHSPMAPMPGVAVTVRGTSVTLAARTNAAGYLILALPPGSYEFKGFGFSKRVVVEAGKTALAALRGGKRMVD